MVEDVSGLEDEVIDRVGDEGKVVLPERKELLSTTARTLSQSKTAKPKFELSLWPVRKKSQSLQNKLTGKIQERKDRELRVNAPESMKYALEVTSRPTCADIFFVPLAIRTNRMGADSFQKIAKRFLGVAVTGELCYMDRCKGVEVHHNGEHEHHASGLRTERHHSLNRRICEAIKQMSRKGHFNYTCHMPAASMEKMGYEKRDRLMEMGKEGMQKTGVKEPAKKERIPDFALQGEDEGDRFFIDTSVVNLKYSEWVDGGTRVGDLLKARVKTKIDIYSGEYEGVSKEKVIPLVFDTYGGYADETIRFLETTVMGMSKNRIAIALHRGQCKVINYLISHGTGKNCGRK